MHPSSPSIASSCAATSRALSAAPLKRRGRGPHRHRLSAATSRALSAAPLKPQRKPVAESIFAARDKPRFKRGPIETFANETWTFLLCLATSRALSAAPLKPSRRGRSSAPQRRDKPRFKRGPIETTTLRSFSEFAPSDKPRFKRGPIETRVVRQHRGDWQGCDKPRFKRGPIETEEA